MTQRNNANHLHHHRYSQRTQPHWYDPITPHRLEFLANALQPATPASPDSSSLSLLPSIFRPFHSVPKPSSKPLTREDILVQTIDELAGQKEDTKRFQIHLATKERDRILSTERTRIRAAKEKGDKESSQDVTQEELDAIRSRLAARPDPKKQNRDFEYRGGEWIRDPEEREKWKRAKGDELGHGVAEKLLALTAEAAAKMKVHEVQINVVIEGKKRVLESERRRIAALEARTEE